MDAEVIRITINNDEKIISLLKRMLEIKTTENKEVECELDGQILTTQDCNNIQDMVVKNNKAIFEEFEKERKTLIQTPEMQQAIERFKVRGKKYDGSEANPEEIAHDIYEKTNSFEMKLSELDTLNFSSSIEVYNWLNSIVEYINNYDLTLPIGISRMDYNNISNYIVKKLEEKGYTAENNVVSNLDDYYRRLISYQISDLDNYRFFAYDYADKLNNENKLTFQDNNVDEEETTLLMQLEEQKKKVLKKLSVVDEYEKGMFNKNREKTLSFEERKNNIQARISELEILASESTMTNINDEFLKANERLKSIATRTGKDQLAAMRFYEAAAGVPFPNNIIPALEKAAELSDNDEIKQPLIDALTKMNVRYSKLQDEQDAALIKETMAKLGIAPYNPNSTMDKEIVELRKEIEKIEIEEKRRIEIEKPVREKLNNELQQIELQIEQEKNKTKAEVETEETQIVEQEEISFEDKLASLAEEGPLFVDTERRLNKEDQWLNANNASNLGKMDNLGNNEVNKTVEATEQETVMEEVDDFIVKEDSLTIPHPIKAIKKASIKLIEKVRNIEFSNKIKAALDWIKEHKKVGLAVATSLMVGGFTLLGAQLNNAQESMNNHVDAATYMESNIEENKEEEVVVNNNEIQPTATEEKTEAELAQDAIDEALNKVLEGDRVYTNAIDAINNENGKTTSERQRENSWTNSEAGAFYDENAKVLNRDEAEEKIAAGEQVVVRYDNNGVPIGYVSVGQQLNNDNSGLSK